MKKNCFKGRFCSKGGFTLIELLVVVLIIGILAAVAVPQYQIAVNKTRFSKLVAQVRTIARAMNLVYLEKGEMPISFEELSIGLPFERIEPLDSYTCGSYADGYCCITPFRKGSFDEKILCGTRDYSFAYVFDLTMGISSCIGKEDSIQSLNLCKHLTQQTNGQSYILVTPQGNKGGYSKFNF